MEEKPESIIEIDFRINEAKNHIKEVEEQIAELEKLREELLNG